MNGTPWCPKCRSVFSAQSIDRATVLFCPSCKGMWLPKGVLGNSSAAGDTDFPDFMAASQTATKTQFVCSICANDVALSRMRYAPNRDLEIEYCSSCGGIFLDFKELSAAQAILRSAKVAPARRRNVDRVVWNRAWELYRRDFRNDRRWLPAQEFWTTLPFRLIRQFSPFVRPPSYQNILYNFIVYGMGGVFIVALAVVLLVSFIRGSGSILRMIPFSIFPVSFLSSGAVGAIGIIILDFFREPDDWPAYLERAEREFEQGAVNGER